MSDKDYGYRELITKAVIGRGKKFSQSAHTISPTHKPSSILGVWVINHKYKAHYSKDCVVVDGSFDVNIWYSYSNNTKTEVVTETVPYKDSVALSVKDKNCISDQFDVIIKWLQEPNALEANISPNANKIVAQIERESLVDVIGETKILVHVDHDDEFVADDEDWDDDIEEAFEDLDPNFLVGEIEE